MLLSTSLANTLDFRRYWQIQDREPAQFQRCSANKTRQRLLIVEPDPMSPHHGQGNANTVDPCASAVRTSIGLNARRTGAM